MFLAFRHILASPERLEVCEVKALPLLHRVREIERRTRLDVIDMPATAPVVVPAHAGLESRLNPADQEMPLTSEQFTDSECCFAAGSHQRIMYSAPVVAQHSENRICLLPCAISGHMSGSHLWALSILCAELGIYLLLVSCVPFICKGFDSLPIFCLPFFLVFPSSLFVLFSPSFLSCVEFFWILFVIASLPYTSKLMFTLRRAYALGDAEFSSVFRRTCSPTGAPFFNRLHPDLYRLIPAIIN
jgi:hypothetical protein